MGQHVGTYQGVRVYGPRAPMELVEKRAKRAKIPLNAIKPCLIRRLSNTSGKPYIIEAWGVWAESPTAAPTGYVQVFELRRDGKVKLQPWTAADVAFDVFSVQPAVVLTPEDDVKMSWDDAKVAWRACRLFADADLTGDEEKARKLRSEAHKLVQGLRQRVTRRDEA